MARQQARRRRRERLGGAALAVLGVLVLVVAVLALNRPHNSSSPAADGSTTAHPSTARPSSTPASSTTPASSGRSHPSSPAPSTSAGASPSDTATVDVHRQHIVVLNNTDIQGLAASAAQQFETDGWTVSEYANYQNNILSTCAYYDASVPDAKIAAKALRRQFPGIRRVEPQFSELASYDSPIVVILTPDWSSG